MARAMERSAARLAAVQALYQMDVTGKTLPDIFAEFETFWIGMEVEGDQYNPAELAFFRDILSGVLKDQEPLDRAINATLVAGWPLARIDSVMRATLRGGAYELKKRRDVPARVVIKEYVDVARCLLRPRRVRHDQCSARRHGAPVPRGGFGTPA